VSEFAARAKAAWTRLIRKVYETMRINALIEDPQVIRSILEHLGGGRHR